MTAATSSYIPRMRVILFDIDGTLVRTGGAGKAAMEAGFRSAFGVAEVQDTTLQRPDRPRHCQRTPERSWDRSVGGKRRRVDAGVPRSPAGEFEDHPRPRAARRSGTRGRAESPGRRVPRPPHRERGGRCGKEARPLRTVGIIRPRRRIRRRPARPRRCGPGGGWRMWSNDWAGL